MFRTRKGSFLLSQGFSVRWMRRESGGLTQPERSKRSPVLQHHLVPAAKGGEDSQPFSKLPRQTLCSLKPDPAEEWACRSSQTCDFPTARWAKENAGSGCGARGCGKRNRRKGRESSLQLFTKVNGKILVLTLMTLYSACLRKRICITEPARHSIFWRKAFLSFKKVYFWK